MKALGQHVDEEAPDELVGGQRHRLVTRGPFDPVVLPLEGDAGRIGCDQPAIGDGDAVGIAREIGEHRRGATERSLSIDDPFDPAQRSQISREGSRVGKRGMIAEEGKPTGRMRALEHLQEQPSKQAREHAYRQEEARPTGHPTCAIKADAAARHNHMNVRMVRHGRAQVWSTAVMPM